MASQASWAAKTQEWSEILIPTHTAFPKLKEGLKGNEAETEEAAIDKFIQGYFARKADEKERCTQVYRELISFVTVLIEVTDHPLLRYKEPQGPKNEIISFLDMVAKVKCIAKAELLLFTSDPIFMGCNRIAYAADDVIPFEEASALPEKAETVNWMTKSLASHAVDIVRAAGETQPDAETTERCSAIFKDLKAYMQQLKIYSNLSALEQWSFYQACIAIFPYVATDDDWPLKIERLAQACLSREEFKKLKTPTSTPKKNLQPQQRERPSSPTIRNLEATSAALLKELRSGAATPASPPAARAVSPPLTAQPQRPVAAAASAPAPVEEKKPAATPPLAVPNAAVAKAVPASAAVPPTVSAEAKASNRASAGASRKEGASEGDERSGETQPLVPKPMVPKDDPDTCCSLM